MLPELGPQQPLGPEQPHLKPKAPQKGRFWATLTVLGVIAGAALAIAVAVVIAHTGGDSTPGKTTASATWSSWKPDASGRQGVTEIADHIAPFYRLNAARQLDVVTPMALTSPNATTGTISGNGLVVAVNTGTTKTEQLALLNGHTIAYDVCGTGGKNCALAGKPSASRLLLLRREALELALYSFKYINNTQNVIAVLPPGKAATTASTSRAVSARSASHHAAKKTKPVDLAVLFVKPELQQWLNVPLKKTLTQFPPDVPELPLWQQSSEAGLVDQVTARGLFSSSIESPNGGGKLMILRSLPPQ